MRIRFSSTSILGVVLLCAVIEAQQPEQVLPEEARKRLEHAIGRWTFVTKVYNRAGEVTREVRGTDTNRYTIPGRVIEHTNEIPTRNATNKGLMFYNFRDKKFYMTSVDKNGDLWILSGGLDKYVLTSRPRKRRDGSESTVRFVHENIRPNSFEARMEFSRDSGKTWRMGSRQFLTRATKSGGDN